MNCDQPRGKQPPFAKKYFGFFLIWIKTRCGGTAAARPGGGSMTYKNAARHESPPAPNRLAKKKECDISLSVAFNPRTFWRTSAHIRLDRRWI
jgi:hypothetical protein